MIEVMGQRMPVIDCHVHVFPDTVRADRIAFTRHDGWFAELYSLENARIASVEDLIESMDRSGIDHAVVCGFPWRRRDICRMHNEYMAEATARLPTRLSWLGIVSPIDSPLEEAQWCFENGALGIGELNADAQGFTWGDASLLQPLIDICAHADRPLLVHSSEPVGHLYPGKGTATPDQLMLLAAMSPNVRVVAAHWGGGLPFYELMPEVRRTLEGVTYDCAATSYLYDFRVFRSTLDIVGAEKVMFGSDFPVLGQERLLKKVANLQWHSAEEARLVLAGTASRVFHLNIGEGTAP